MLSASTTQPGILLEPDEHSHISYKSSLSARTPPSSPTHGDLHRTISLCDFRAIMPEMYTFQAGSKPISSLASDESTAKFTPNILPCRIHHDGPIESTNRFWIPQTDEKGMHSITCSNAQDNTRISWSDTTCLQTTNKQRTSVDVGFEAGAWRFPKAIKVRGTDSQ